MIDKIISSVNEFFSSATFNPKVFVYNTKEETYYNEANLQHELALYLKQKFQDIIELRLEYPVNKLLKIGKTKLSKKEIKSLTELEGRNKRLNDDVSSSESELVLLYSSFCSKLFINKSKKKL